MTQAGPDTLDAIAALQRLAELFSERRLQLARESGITETLWRVLEEVDDESFIPSMFARRRSCTPSAVSRTLRQLLERELVRASIGETDSRQRIYRLTAKGRRALRRLSARRQQAIDAIWAPMRRSDLRSFTRFANDLADRLEDYTEKQ
ncbi:MAG: winged helix DNA-binding protein [Myxococcota bacterium]